MERECKICKMQYGIKPAQICQTCFDNMCNYEKSLTWEKMQLEKLLHDWQRRANEILGYIATCRTVPNKRSDADQRQLLSDIIDADLGGE